MTDRIYIGLLRGINVGGVVLKMADLKEAVADLGFENIKTYLQSGNMVFRAKKSGDDTLASRISSAIAEKSGRDIPVMIRTSEEWNRLIEDNPFPQAVEQPKTIHAFILDRQPDKAKADEIAARDFGTEQWEIVGDTLYLHTPDGFGKSKLGNSIERLLKVPMTGRNWNTVLALKEMAGEL